MHQHQRQAATAKVRYLASSRGIPCLSLPSILSTGRAGMGYRVQQLVFAAKEVGTGVCSPGAWAGSVLFPPLPGLSQVPCRRTLPNSTPTYPSILDLAALRSGQDMVERVRTRTRKRRQMILVLSVHSLQNLLSPIYLSWVTVRRVYRTGTMLWAIPK